MTTPAHPLQSVLDGLELPEMDCGDNSCAFATKRTGMRTNGGCRCADKLSKSQIHLFLRNMKRAHTTIRAMMDVDMQSVAEIAKILDARTDTQHLRTPLSFKALLFREVISIRDNAFAAGLAAREMGK